MEVQPAVFYKAAFYDRSASISLTGRFSISRDYERKDVAVSTVKDGETVIFSTEPQEIPTEKPWTAREAADAIALTWLNERYPEHADPTAYWE